MKLASVERFWDGLCRSGFLATVGRACRLGLDSAPAGRPWLPESSSSSHPFSPAVWDVGPGFLTADTGLWISVSGDGRIFSSTSGPESEVGRPVVPILGSTAVDRGAAAFRNVIRMVARSVELLPG